MNSIELLSPVGDFECLKAAVQNGANAVYLGASSFSARSSAKNFNLEELEEAINYASLRNVKVHLALNTLIKNEEFDDAISLAAKAYELGVSAIIVQDFGLAKTLIENLPNLPIHASTQMSIHNLEGAQTAEKLGFSRVVLARELSLPEIRFIHDNCNIEIETFAHGALCICYSGQCLMSSMIGARSGNRGKCAQACRLPYELISDDGKSFDKGYLLSPRDLCGLEYVPDFIESGVTSLKIEGRMKTPEYVATVTRIYRKYIDLALSGKEYVIDDNDIKDLMQVFNRGGFSSGHLNSSANKGLIFKEKPNNMGIYIGNVSGYQASKGYIIVNLNDSLSLGDTVSVERESTKYRVSELMKDKRNILDATSGMEVKIGRIKGDVRPGDKVYKLESKALTTFAKSSYSKEYIKNKLSCNLEIHKNQPIVVQITTENGLSVHIISDIQPTEAVNNPITKERIILQFSKTGSTPFEFGNFNIDLEDDLYINISDLNELRRKCLAQLESTIIANNKRILNNPVKHLSYSASPKHIKAKKVSLLLNTLDINANYALLHDVDRIYLPIYYFGNAKYSNIIKTLSASFNLYIYVSNIIKTNYKNLFKNIIDRALEDYYIKGFVVSDLGSFELLKDYSKDYRFIGNYTLNVFNNVSVKYYQKLGIDCIALSPELSKEKVISLCDSIPISKELLVYGNLPVMTCSYCFLGKSNKCYPECPAYCQKNEKYYLRDRMGYDFRIVPDNVNNITTIYNSKITSIEFEEFNVDYVRISILDENIWEINNIIDTVKSGKKFAGKNYTNGNLNREV